MCFNKVWKRRYDELRILYEECQEKNLSLGEYINSLEAFIADQQLEPPPNIEFVIKDAEWVYIQLINDVPDEMIILPLVDPEYKILDEENFRKMAEWIWTSEKEYIPTFYDCDDFYLHFIAIASRYFEVNSIAQVVDYSSSHAYNMPILKKGAAIYEPQTRQLFTVIGNRNVTHYGLKEGYIQI